MVEKLQTSLSYRLFFEFFFEENILFRLMKLCKN